MNKVQNRTHRPQRLSLLPLKIVLMNARNQAPANAPAAHRDANDEQALHLINMMKLQFKRRAHPVHWMDSSVRLRELPEEMAGSDA